MMPPYSAQEAIGAIRLAMEAGADNGVRARVIREILASAPDQPRADTRSVALLIEAVQATDAEFRVTDHEPRGRLARTPRRSHA